MILDFKESTCGDLLTRYDVIKSYNIEKISEAQLLFLAENHISKDCQKLNGRLISAIIEKEGSVAIFLEGISSMKPLTIPKERLRELMCLDLKVNMDNVQVFGWDMDDNVLFQKKHAHFQKIEDYNNSLPRVEKEISCLEKLMQNCLLELTSIIPEFDVNKFEEFGLTWMCKISNEDSPRFMQNFKNLMEFTKKKLNLEYQTLCPTFNDFLRDNMLERTQNMTQTAQKIVQMQLEGTLPNIAIFVAGVAHLKQLNLEVEECCLEPFYKEISKHKSMILSPKGILTGINN
jgi:hypothetical protein